MSSACNCGTLQQVLHLKVQSSLQARSLCRHAIFQTPRSSSSTPILHASAYPIESRHSLQQNSKQRKPNHNRRPSPREPHPTTRLTRLRARTGRATRRPTRLPIRCPRCLTRRTRPPTRCRRGISTKRTQEIAYRQNLRGDSSPRTTDRERLALADPRRGDVADGHRGRGVGSAFVVVGAAGPLGWISNVTYFFGEEGAGRTRDLYIRVVIVSEEDRGLGGGEIVQETKPPVETVIG
jgi:hypothetical protein